MSDPQPKSPSSSGTPNRFRSLKMPQSSFEPEHFINRELSWLEFNARVLEEAQDPSTPLLERVKFLAIFSSNLDEFFMVRVAGLREQAFAAGAPQDVNPDGLKALEQLQGVGERTRELVDAQYACLNEVVEELRTEGLLIVDHEEVKKNKKLDAYFDHTVFPIITPMAIDPSHPRPRYHNRALYLMAQLRRRKGLGPRNLSAVVQLPQVLPRLVPIPGSSGADQERRFILLEDLIGARMPELFGGFEVEAQAAFRILRDSDVDILRQEADDMLRLIEERLLARRRGDAVRLEISDDAPEALVAVIVKQEQLRTESASEEAPYSEVYRTPGPIDLTGFFSLVNVPGFGHLREAPIVPQVPRGLRRHGEDLFAAISRRDVLLHHPYDSFDPVVDFVRSAAEDPSVLAIKQTLYRTSGDSPIIRALMEAAENGKHVTALVELQARFDEAANVSWARQMERSGVHVVYGFMDLKTHCKVSLVVRQEDAVVKRYVHLGTGNYNPATAKVYTDLGLFTADRDIGIDVSALFNLLTGYSQGHRWRKLVVAPEDLQSRTIELIREQADRASQGEPARIFAKLNSLVDPNVIDALFSASQAGVPIDLFVRGICCLRPGIKGVSENIRVRSIVDRFLEHSRIFVFGPDDDAKIFFSSADWMPRNFHRRVEVMFPVEAASIHKRVLREIVPAFQKDNVRARELVADGTYHRVQADKTEPPWRCQTELMRIHLENAAKSSSLAMNAQEEMEQSIAAVTKRA